MKWLDRLFRRRSAEPEETGQEPLDSDRIVELLRALFEHHGVSVDAQDGVLDLGDGHRIEAVVVNEEVHGNGRTCQLDLYLEMPDGQVLVESFAGMGEDRRRAVGNALESFIRSSFHVILRGLLREGEDEQVEVEQWDVRGRRYTATIGGVTSRGTHPDGQVPTGWFPELESAIRNADLTADAYWVRFYYAQMNRKAMAVEVLLNNEPWISAREAMGALSWPLSDDFYSVRLFLILRRAA